MKLANLQAQAQQIIDLTNKVTEESVTFMIDSGKPPADLVGVGEFIVRQSQDFKYTTAWNGHAYEVETIVRCQDTKTKDANNRTIYLLPNGVTFVWEFKVGNAENFDWGCFASPVFN